LILVDTSVWIDFLTGRNSPFRRELHGLIEAGKPIAINAIIFQEILQGVRSDLEFKKLEKYLLNFPCFSFGQIQTFRDAAQIYRTCRQRGKTIRKPVDCLIAAQALAENLVLFHRDRDFDSIALFFPLKIHLISH